MDVNNDHNSNTIDKLFSKKFHKLAVAQNYIIIQQRHQLCGYKSIICTDKVYENITNLSNENVIDLAL